MRALTRRSKTTHVSSSDDGYVHDPSRFDEDGTPLEESVDEAADETRNVEADEVVYPTSTERSFGWRGWVLVGVIGLAFIVAPALIYLWPVLFGYETSYIFALIVIPLIPAVLLAAAAVWATTRP